MTRAYYAAFSAVTLLHYLAGNSYSSHRQILGQFNKQFIHTGIFKKEMGVELQDLLLKRQKTDYDASARFSHDGAEETLDDARVDLRRSLVRIAERHIRASSNRNRSQTVAKHPATPINVEPHQSTIPITRFDATFLREETARI